MNTTPSPPAASVSRHTPEPVAVFGGGEHSLTVVRNPRSTHAAYTIMARTTSGAVPVSRVIARIPDGLRGGTYASRNYAEQIVSSLNATAGMTDPAAEIAALRECAAALRSAMSTMDRERTPNDLISECTSALAKLAAAKGGQP